MRPVSLIYAKTTEYPEIPCRRLSYNRFLVNATNELHRFIDEWLKANGTNWETLRKEAGVSAPVGTDIRRGSTPGPDTLERLSEAMRVPIRELYELSGYVERGELDPVETPVPDDYEIRSFFTDNAWDGFTADEKEIVCLGMRMVLKSKLNRD